MSQTPSHILENLQTALPAVAKAIKGGWDNIQNLAIKTNSSVSLPIWSCTLNMTESRSSNSLQNEDAVEGDEDVEKEEDEEEKTSRKGRKHATNSDEEIEGVEKPRKRSKVADGMVRGVISKKEMRQKRSANTGEKKKRIVIKSKGSKSVKNVVLGKKVGTSP